MNNIANARRVYERSTEELGRFSTSHIPLTRRLIFPILYSFLDSSSFLSLSPFFFQHSLLPFTYTIGFLTGELANDADLYTSFAQFEERCKEVERARAIYRFALDNLPKSKAEVLYQAYMSFEKQFGDREGVEDAVVGKRRFQYEELLKENPMNYDTWFDYLRLEEDNGDVARTREVNHPCFCPLFISYFLFFSCP